MSTVGVSVAQPYNAARARYEKRLREWTKRHRKLGLRRTHGGRLVKSRVTPPADFQHDLGILRKRHPSLPHCTPVR